MPQADADRWDVRYLNEERYAALSRPRAFLVEQAHLLPESGLVLDAAMGLGGSAGFLLERSLRVVGVDISVVAARKARQRLPGLMAVIADLRDFRLPAQSFDVVINFYYLERSLWAEYERILRPGGLLICETLTLDMLAVHPDTDPAYLLAPGELRQAFNDWEVLAYREGWVGQGTPRPRAVASLAARKP